MSEYLDDTLDRQLADRLRALRGAQGWSLDELARRSGVSRATLSRLENAETSPTAAVLGRLCAAHGLTLTALMRLVEDGFAPLVRPADQPVFRDPAAGFTRRAVSPPARDLAGEGLDVTLAPGARLAYDAPPRPGLEHHLYLLEGALDVTIEGRRHALAPGDCLRYRLHGPSAFATDTGARYVLFLT
ncbi:helix-turn-helix domain-containing protein [Amaricoccus sp.]|uniref:helix-turn-helix domain-containing protein n=1 Tax=Amaricoccus sp. TaxID=1872485 RepID=UPI001B4F80B5|nr:XRE family transcriptional regulator [Amaricoccus sp.]MBP7241128.1 helix-turn-helix domain-containing protein [Amaricoccus sp.]